MFWFSMIRINLILSFGMLSKTNSFDIFETGRVETRSVRYNESCDALENSKVCEEGCGILFQDCFLDCESRGQC